MKIDQIQADDRVFGKVSPKCMAPRYPCLVRATQNGHQAKGGIVLLYNLRVGGARVSPTTPVR